MAPNSPSEQANAKPGGGQQRLPHHRQVDDQHGADGRGAEGRGGLAQAVVDARDSTGTSTRTTSGSATSAWAIGISRGESRRSSGGLPEGDQEAEAEGHRGDPERQHEEAVEHRPHASLGAGARAPGDDQRHREPEQQGHPGRVDGDPQASSRRASVTGTSSAWCEPGRLQGAVVGEAPAAVDAERGRPPATRAGPTTRTRRTNVVATAGASPARGRRGRPGRGPPSRPAYVAPGPPRRGAAATTSSWRTESAAAAWRSSRSVVSR